MGAAEAKLCAEEGAQVIFGDVRDQEGFEVESDITESGGIAKYVHLDVTKERDWENAIDSAISMFGRLDILVNNAGIIMLSLVEDMPAEMWDDIINVNAKGVFLGTKFSIPHMKRNGGGSIINISSTAGIIASASIAYGASKGAVRLFTKSTAVEYGGDGIRCNSVHPGFIETPMQAASMSNQDQLATTESRIPLQRYGTAREVANAVVFLASDESSYITGSEIVVDGGYIAQ